MGNGFFDNLFDFNGDGAVDIGEELLAFMMFKEMMEDENDKDDTFNLFEEDI